MCRLVVEESRFEKGSVCDLYLPNAHILLKPDDTLCVCVHISKADVVWRV